MSSAAWISLANLGSFQTNYNFNINPITLYFTSDYNATVKVLNGSLPAGLSYNIGSDTITIQGESTGVISNSEITFRITDPDKTIADRTFYISIIPVIATPNWENQNTFLGYATLDVQSTYTVVATDTTHIQYSLINPPADMNINSITGVITYTPNISLAKGQSTYYNNLIFKIRATSGSLYADLSVNIIVVSYNYSPLWITPAGSLGTFITGSYVETAISAYNPSGFGLVYTISQSSPNFPLTLTETGFLYGRLPTTNSNLTYSFTAIATGSNGSANQTFVINVVQDTVNSALNWNNTSTVLGPFTDGQIVDIDVSANTTRPNAFLYYSFNGGTLPTNLRLNVQQGHISGFLEYHVQPRSYYFEISVTDGVQQLTRTYELSVIRGTYDIFVNVGLPIMSDTKSAIFSTKQSMVPSASDVPYSATLTDNVPVEMNLISGLSYIDGNCDVIFNTSNLYLHSTLLLFGSISHANINASGDNVFYNNVIDPNNGAAFNLNTPNVYVQSLQNMREALSQNSFSNDGLGQGASIIPILNVETAGIGSVDIANAGSNYYSAPKLTVIGSGNGAILQSNITVSSVDIINPGNNWTTGQQFNVIIDSEHTVSLQATAVNNGALHSVTVLNGENFQYFPYGNKIVTSGESDAELHFNLSISDVNIINGGNNYTTTSSVNTDGTEILPVWQSSWIPAIPICTVDYAAVYNTNANITSDTLSILQDTDWRIKFLVFDIQGKRWTGNTMFDDLMCSFDGGQTAFVEWIEPINVTFDIDNTTFDIEGTRFDDNKQFLSSYYKMFGNTIFDEETTIFDLYQTLFDEAGPSSESITKIRKLYRLLSSTVNSNNLVY